MKNRFGWALCLSLAACGPMPSGNGGSQPSVVGTWVAQAPDTANFSQRTYRLVFVGSAQSGMFTWQNQGTGKVGGDSPGCTANFNVGGSYTVNGSSLSLTPMSGTETFTNCTNAADNVENGAIPNDGLTKYNESGTFSISGSSMTFNSMYDGTLAFTRQ